MNINITNDITAEKTINELKAMEQEKNRIVKLCNDMIEDYKMQIQQNEEKYKEIEDIVKFHLADYLKGVEPKETDTQYSYKLAKHKVVLKKDSYKIVKTDELINHIPNDFIEVITEQKIKWGDYKKTLEVAGNTVINKDGEIVKGVAAELVQGYLQIK